MKNLLRRRFLPAILCMVLALGLSACGGKDTPPVETETDGAMGTLSGSKGEKDSGVGVFSGSGEEIAEAELAEESLNLLYDVMAYDDRYAGAVAYLGYRKQGDSTPLSDWLVENCAGLVEAMPFLLQMCIRDSCTAVVQPHWLRQGQHRTQSDAGRNRADNASC